jgi:FKBP-type peptidyl-prolyl cis-trans isomerase SlyD
LRPNLKHMKIEKGKWVAVEYTLYTDGPEGEIIEETSDDSPFEFVFGEDDLLEKFEEAIAGKQAGEAFSVLIASDDAYGPEVEDAIVELPKETFMVDGEIDEDIIQVGEVVPMNDDEGNELQGLIVELKLNTIVVDFNHPLAGMDLYFDGEIKQVKDA